MAFAGALGNFTFQTIGEQTDDEKMIGMTDDWEIYYFKHFIAKNILYS